MEGAAITTLKTLVFASKIGKHFLFSHQDMPDSLDWGTHFQSYEMPAGMLANTVTY